MMSIEPEESSTNMTFDSALAEVCNGSVEIVPGAATTCGMNKEVVSRVASAVTFSFKLEIFIIDSLQPFAVVRL